MLVNSTNCNSTVNDIFYVVFSKEKALTLYSKTTRGLLPKMFKYANDQ